MASCERGGNSQNQYVLVLQKLKVLVVGEVLVLAPFTLERLRTQRHGAQRYSTEHEEMRLLVWREGLLRMLVHFRLELSM